MKPTLREVEAAVCARFNLTTDKMRGLGRAKHIMRPRQIAMFLARDMVGASFPKIGMHFCRDHSTVQHAVDNIREMVVTHPKIAVYVEECRTAILGAEGTKREWFKTWGDRAAAGEVSWTAERREESAEAA